MAVSIDAIYISRKFVSEKRELFTIDEPTKKKNFCNWLVIYHKCIANSSLPHDDINFTDSMKLNSYSIFISHLLNLRHIFFIKLKFIA